jgi:eukaryotic-like serine/threonine-protein kinase
MGEVYRARDKRLGRDVAIKVLPASFTENAESMARFTREAQTLASLNHPGIASIFGLEESAGVRGIVMELVEGSTLADRLRRGALPLEEGLNIARQVAEAIEYAHERGVIHRDLKPANIKVTPDGQVKLLDFGLAKAIESDSPAHDSTNSPTLTAAATQMGIILGTAAYMSPEQARGKAVDRRADIWAFGVLLFEMLTGQPLHEGDTTSEILARVIEREPDLSRSPASTPAPIRELLRRCLTRNPRQRLRDIGDARIVIEEYLANPAAAQPTPGTSASPKPRSLPLLWLCGGLVLGVLIAALVGWKLQSAAPAPPMMRFSAVTNFTGVDAQPSFSPDGRSIAFLSNRGGAFDIWVGLVAGGSPVRITNDPNFKAHPHWSPDGSKISFNRLNESGLWDIWTVPSLGGTPRKLLSDATDSAWSADGASLAYANGSTRTIWMCDASGGNAHQITQPEPKAWHTQPALSRDGQSVAFVRRASGPYGELAAADVASGKVQLLTNDAALALSPVWSVDGKFVYFASTRGGSVNLWKIPAEGGSPMQITAGRGDDVSLDISADGQRIVFDSQRWAVNLLEVELDAAGDTGRKWLTTDVSRGTIAPVYSPDGKHIAYFTNRKGAETEAIWMMDADGSNPVKLVEDKYVNVFPRWASDSQSLVFTSRNRGVQASRIVRKVSVSGTVPEEFPVQLIEAGGVDVRPDGHLLFRERAGQVQSYDPASNQTEALGSVEGGILHWSPDGQHIASIHLARRADDPDAGVWVYDQHGGSPHQVFRGWATAYTWTGASELFVLEGKPNLDEFVWRVHLDGSAPVRSKTVLRLDFVLTDVSSNRPAAYSIFDVHPDHKRLVTEAFRFQESDISMLENIR